MTQPKATTQRIHDQQLVKAIHDKDVGRVRDLLQRLHANPNSISRESGLLESVLERAYFSTPEILIAVLEAGARMDIEIGQAKTSPLILGVGLPEKEVELRNAILLATGAKLTENDKAFIAKLKETRHIPPTVDFKFYVEKVDEGRLARPTVATLKKKYDLTFDLEARATALQELGITPDTAAINTPEHQGNIIEKTQNKSAGQAHG